MPDNAPSFEVELIIPPRPEFVGVARLSIARVASLMPFSFDDVEDIRLAVGEACTRAIERLDGRGIEGQPISLRCLIDANRLTIEVRNPLLDLPPQDAAVDPAGAEGELSGVLIRILMDEVDTEESPGDGMHVVRMVKYVAR